MSMWEEIEVNKLTLVYGAPKSRKTETLISMIAKQPPNSTCVTVFVGCEITADSLRTRCRRLGVVEDFKHVHVETYRQFGRDLRNTIEKLAEEHHYFYFDDVAPLGMDELILLHRLVDKYRVNIVISQQICLPAHTDCLNEKCVRCALQNETDINDVFVLDFQTAEEACRGEYQSKLLSNSQKSTT